MTGTVMSVNISTEKGKAKRPVEGASLREGWGVEGDVHAGAGIKQVSLLAWESVQRQLEELRKAGVQCPKAQELTAASGAQAAPGAALHEIHPGDYAENLTVKGVDLKAVSPGDRISVGPDVVLEVTTIGKECHYHCAVYKRLGDCVMPREGVFAKVLRGGHIASGDEIRVEKAR